MNSGEMIETETAVMHQSLRLGFGHYSVAGVKSHNDDSVAAHLPDEPALTAKGAVFLIADGLSTAEKGRQASELCALSFVQEYYHTPELWSVKHAALNTLIALNRKLYGLNHAFQEPARGYASTLSLVIVKSHTAHIFHVGDSRVYLLRDGALELLTKDHAEANENSFALTRAMGTDITLQIDYRSIALQENDTFVMSTDGIHDILQAQEMAEIICSHLDDYEAACVELAETALEHGSRDNLSCQIFKASELSSKSVDDLQHLVVMKPFPPPLSIGYKVDGYRVLKELHASSRSQVYLVEDEESGEQLVMKTPSLNYQDDPAYIDRFCIEEWVGRRIKNDHIVRVIAPKRAKSFLYYLMEYVEGESLQAWMQHHRSPSGGKVIALARQIVDGINALHQVETIHRDLKPGNIIIDKEGRVKIVDLGSVYVASIAEIQSPIDTTELLGTINYTAPEYRLGQTANPRMDQFSLATVLYEMLTGSYPYGGALGKCKTDAEFKKLKYTPSFKFNEEIPIWFDGTLKRGCAVSSSERYDDMDHFLADLAHPNPYYLTDEYMTHLEDTLPTVDLGVMFGVFWGGTLLLALLVFFL